MLSALNCLFSCLKFGHIIGNYSVVSVFQILPMLCELQNFLALTNFVHIGHVPNFEKANWADILMRFFLIANFFILNWAIKYYDNTVGI